MQATRLAVRTTRRRRVRPKTRALPLTRTHTHMYRGSRNAWTSSPSSRTSAQTSTAPAVLRRKSLSGCTWRASALTLVAVLMRPYVVRLARYTSKAKAEEKHAQERRMREAVGSNGRKPFVPQVRPPHRCEISVGLPLARFGLARMLTPAGWAVQITRPSLDTRRTPSEPVCDRLFASRHHSQDIKAQLQLQYVGVGAPSPACAARVASVSTRPYAQRALVLPHRHQARPPAPRAGQPPVRVPRFRPPHQQHDAEGLRVHLQRPPSVHARRRARP
mgnify:CR=1 FL=1